MQRSSSGLVIVHPQLVLNEEIFFANIFLVFITNFLVTLHYKLNVIIIIILLYL